MQIPRYVPSRQFPPYSYVSGMWPHPVSNPHGHSFGHCHFEVSLPPRADWQSCGEWLFGVDLFNHGYYWESHEAWERLWHATGRKNIDADFFKGLIKLAAAGVKAREGEHGGVIRHLTRGHEILNSVRNEVSVVQPMWGIALTPLLSLIEHWKQLPFNEGWTATTSVLRVWDENLELTRISN